ncbi:MAG TPA: hemolysin family protein [Terriglobales bacterium]|nr:hemolysin family protein [Terriglobales bacterium]
MSLIAIPIVLMLAVLTLVSYVDRLYTEIGKFLSREFQDNIDAFEQRVEPRLRVSRARSALSMAVLTQLSMAAIALMVGYAVFHDKGWNTPEILQATVSLVLIVIVCNRLLPFVFFSRTRGTWLNSLVPVLRVLIYLVMPVTLVIGFCQSVASLTREHSEELPEHASEAVDALIEAGQEEGILQEADRELIQSVVQFGEKTAREAMTPRPEMVAVPVDTTVERFLEMLRSRRFSRVPVYEGSLDNIKGIVFVHDLLQVADTEAPTRTVASLMHTDTYFVPETKRTSELLREMQKNNVRMAIVIDEYGGVAGLVTIEDLVEEIVGEIRDEHESKDIVREADNSVIVPGNMDVDRLDQLFGVHLDGHEATTVAGLVSEILGHIPQKGEIVEGDGLRFEILESTDRRVQRLRVRAVQAATPQ